MREHVMNEVDKNKDSYITMQEFLDSTKTEDFDKDEGWKVSQYPNFLNSHWSSCQT